MQIIVMPKMDGEMVLLIRDDDTIPKRTPMWVRVIVAAIAERGDDETAFVEMRKAFHMLPPELQKRLVKAAWNYPEDELSMVRRLISELSEGAASEILGYGVNEILARDPYDDVSS